MLPPMELAGDDEPLVIPVAQVRFGGRLQQPPVVLVDLDHRLAKVVDLVQAAELAQALDATSQVLANLLRVVLGVQRKRR